MSYMSHPVPVTYNNAYISLRLRANTSAANEPANPSAAKGGGCRSTQETAPWCRQRFALKPEGNKAK